MPNVVESAKEYGLLRTVLVSVFGCVTAAELVRIHEHGINHFRTEYGRRVDDVRFDQPVEDVVAISCIVDVGATVEQVVTAAAVVMAVVGVDAVPEPL